MVEQSDRAPLLDWEEIPPAEHASSVPPAETGDSLQSGLSNYPSQGGVGADKSQSTSPANTHIATAVLGESPGSPSKHGGPGGDDSATDEEGDCTFHGLSVRDRRIAEWEEKDQIVAVFVVTFDTRSGCYFGLACFANMPVESELERGARMKSVGILCTSYTLLYRYMHFLENQVRHQLQCPGQYSPLEAFYEDKKAILPPGGNGLVTACPSSALGPIVNRCMHPEMKITHPAGCMSQFIRFFGEQIMVLWKFALLRKRILIFSPPPVGVVCYRVYCCCCLANVSIPGMGVSVPELRPFFYINVADITTLETELSYVACTTEKIFEEKKELYDVYIDNQNVKTHRESLQPLLRLNSADREKYRKLCEQRFFMEQNNRIFQTLSEVAASADSTLTAEQVRAMGLDPQGDRGFLVDLLEVYGIDVMLVIDNPCCP
ncbi:Protein LCHN [Triplophysa tibetana]|uniref:DENN domain-containing protein 11 n=1 Tax=Triplophysa tibetana TaxID=1572043 RepID=A0A5A9NYV8_9TELE|nr:Protein LCHN [Triplophysa tibetana]